MGGGEARSGQEEESKETVKSPFLWVLLFQTLHERALGALNYGL